MKLPSTRINLFGSWIFEIICQSCSKPVADQLKDTSSQRLDSSSPTSVSCPVKHNKAISWTHIMTKEEEWAHLISLSPSTPLPANAAFRWDWQRFEKTNVRSIHPQCRYYSWILRHRRLGRFEKTLTPSRASAWLSFISGVVIRGVHLASSKLTDEEACSIHRYDLVVMLSSRATLTSQSHF